MRFSGEQVLKLLTEMIAEISPYSTLDKNTLLIEEGVLNSLGIMTLIAMIEERFDIIIKDEDVVLDAFKSITAIEKLLENYGD